jgi:hypothetical protein
MRRPTARPITSSITRRVPSTRLALAVVLTAGLVLTGSPPSSAGASSAGAAPAAHSFVRQPVIPDRAMLQPADMRGAVPSPVTDDYWAALRPPQPCAAAPYPSTVLRRTDRAVTAMVAVNERPSVVLHDVAVYRPGGAHRYLRELRRAVAACERPGPDAARWSVLATGVAGDESVLLRKREYVDYAEVDKDTFMLVARVGRALVVVADAGWEEGDGHRALVRELGAVAVRRAAVLNPR